MTNIKYIFLVSLICCRADSIRVLSHSPPQIVLHGKNAVLFCSSDEEFDTCSWLLPNQEVCGPLSTTQGMCRGAHTSNIHFNGDKTNCSIRIDDLEGPHSGSWTCRSHRYSIKLAD